LMFSLLPCKHPVSDCYQVVVLTNNVAPSPGLRMAMLYAVLLGSLATEISSLTYA